MKFHNCTPKFFLQRITAPNGESWSYNKTEVPEEIGVYTTGILVNPGHDKWFGKVVLVGMFGLQQRELKQFDSDPKKIETLCGKIFWTHKAEEVTDRTDDYWGRP